MKEGNKVELISGSITMTIEWVEDGYAMCIYWDGNKCENIRQKIKMTALKLVD